MTCWTSYKSHVISINTINTINTLIASTCIFYYCVHEQKMAWSSWSVSKTIIIVLHTVFRTEKSTFCQASPNCNNPSFWTKDIHWQKTLYWDPCGVWNLKHNDSITLLSSNESCRLIFQRTEITYSKRTPPKLFT